MSDYTYGDPIYTNYNYYYVPGGMYYSYWGYYTYYQSKGM